jgi:5-methyltetrahydropteroyltriglutamate--homocysteine methyltransferase
MKIRSTVIGSYPVVGEGTDAVRTAVSDQLEAGIEVISDGQTRKDMLSYFADHLEGFKVEEGRSYIVGKIKPPEATPIIQDLLLAKEIAGNRAEVKAVVTGPVTMVFFSELTPSAPYNGFRDENLYKDISEALATEAELIQREGFASIQFDEPSFSIGAPMAIARKSLETTVSYLKGVKTLHVCGNLKRSFGQIVEIEGIDVLSFAFKDSVSNFDTVEKRLLEDNSKRLGIGCVSSSQGDVEDIGIIKGVVKRALDAYGEDNLAWIHPDCGLRTLEHETAKSKLKNMVSALKDLEGDLE